MSENESVSEEEDDEVETVVDNLVDYLAREFASQKFPNRLNLPKPGGKETLWRYIDFTQYVSIISRGQLHFARPDQLNDKFEGSLPEKNIEARKNWIDTSELSEEVDMGSLEITDEDLEVLIDSSLEKLNKNVAKKVVLNCWHKEPREKAAMWGNYTQSGNGIAIKSKFEDLVEAVSIVDENGRVVDGDAIKSAPVGEVSYINYRTEEIPDTIVHPFFTKRESFSNENEVRIAEYKGDDEFESKGIYVDIDVEKLIDEIRLEPESPNWFEDLVIEVTDDLGYEIDVNRSELERTPLY